MVTRIDLLMREEVDPPELVRGHGPDACNWRCWHTGWYCRLPAGHEGVHWHDPVEGDTRTRSEAAVEAFDAREHMPRWVAEALGMEIPPDEEVTLYRNAFANAWCLGVGRGVAHYFVSEPLRVHHIPPEQQTVLPQLAGVTPGDGPKDYTNAEWQVALQIIVRHYGVW